MMKNLSELDRNARSRVLRFVLSFHLPACDVVEALGSAPTKAAIRDAVQGLDL